MSGANVKLNDLGQLILSNTGNVLFSQNTLGLGCLCSPCTTLNCAYCQGAGTCCYDCNDEASVTFGTVTVDPSSSGDPFYDVAVDLASAISGNTVVFTNMGSGGAAAYLLGNVSKVDSSKAYFWRMRLLITSGTNGSTASTFTIQFRVASLPLHCFELGDTIPRDYNCGPPFDSLLFANLEQEANFGNASGTGNCCGNVASWTETVTSSVYFSAFSTAITIAVDSCSLCDGTDYPSSLLFDTAQLTSPCPPSTGNIVLAQDPIGSARYTGDNGLPSGSGLISITLVLGSTIVSANCGENQCYWRLTIGGDCSVVYEKCGDPDDPTGTYTEAGGTATVDVT